MGPILGAAVDVLHALFMAAWVLGLPLLFWHRFPRITRAYAIYAIAFVVLNQASELVLGECFLTTLARIGWQHTGSTTSATLADPDEWFTVRFAQAIFHLTPSHRGIKLASEGLILTTAIGVTYRALVARRASRRAIDRDAGPMRPRVST